MFHECMVSKPKVYEWVQEVRRIMELEGVPAARITRT